MSLNEHICHTHVQSCLCPGDVAWQVPTETWRQSRSGHRHTAPDHSGPKFVPGAPRDVRTVLESHEYIVFASPSIKSCAIGIGSGNAESSPSVSAHACCSVLSVIATTSATVSQRTLFPPPSLACLSGTSVKSPVPQSKVACFWGNEK